MSLQKLLTVAGFTPLQAAVIENHVEVVERLLDAGVIDHLFNNCY